jgi:hypothetical protein
LGCPCCDEGGVPPPSGRCTVTRWARPTSPRASIAAVWRSQGRSSGESWVARSSSRHPSTTRVRLGEITARSSRRGPPRNQSSGIHRSGVIQDQVADPADLADIEQGLLSDEIERPDLTPTPLTPAGWPSIRRDCAVVSRSYSTARACGAASGSSSRDRPSCPKLARRSMTARAGRGVPVDRRIPGEGRVGPMPLRRQRHLAHPEAA